MKRLLIFGLLAPPLGLAIGVGILLPVLNLALGDQPQWDWRQVVLMPLAYMLGLVPALVTAVFDEALARRKVGWRPLWTGAFGFAMSFLPLATAILYGMVHGPFLLIFGLVGALPGAICSWLAGPRSVPAAAR